MYSKLALLLLATVLSFAPADQIRLRLRVVADADTPLGRNEHPRMHVTEDNIASIRTNMATGGFLASEAQTWFAWIDANYATSWGINDKPWAASAFAFASIVLRDGAIAGISPAHSSADYGNLAADLALAVPGEWSNQADAALAPVAYAYDWAWDYFSAGERSTMVTFFKTIDNVTYNHELANTFTVYRRLVYYTFALAILGDGIDDAWAQTKVDSWNTYFRHATTGLHTTYSQYGSPDGSNPEGNSYGWYYNIRAHFWAEEAYRTANAISVATQYGTSDTNVMRYQPINFNASILPLTVSGNYILNKWNYMRAAETVGSAADTPCWMSMIATLYDGIDNDMAALASWLYTNRTSGLGTGNHVQLQLRPICRFTMPADRRTASSPTTLSIPTTRAWTEGKFTMQDAWADTDTPQVTYWAGKWAVTPYHSLSRAPGNFTVDRNGPMVIQQGGKSGHDWGGGMYTGSANMLIFPDRSRTTPASAYEDYGGARLFPGPNGGSVTWDLVTQDSVMDTRDALAYRLADRASGRDVDYIMADHTRAYNSSLRTDGVNDAKVSSVVRKFVYFRPATDDDSVRLVIYDRAVTLDTDFEKEWLFHTSSEPTVTGHSGSAAGPSRGGTTEGKTSYTDPTEATATQTTSPFDGKVFLTPLLPASRTIVKVGGNNGSAQAWQSDSHEYETPYGEAGAGQSGAPDAGQEPYVGRWRLEIIPTTPATTDIFVNAVEVGDSTASKSTTQLIQGTNFDGARAGDRIAVFNNTTSNVTSGTFIIPSSGTYQVLVEGLAASTSLAVTGGANISAISSIDPSDASSPFTSTSASGDYSTGTLYLSITVDTNGSGAANTVTIATAEPVPALVPPLTIAWPLAIVAGWRLMRRKESACPAA